MTCATSARAIVWQASWPLERFCWGLASPIRTTGLRSVTRNNPPTCTARKPDDRCADRAVHHVVAERRDASAEPFAPVLSLPSHGHTLFPTRRGLLRNEPRDLSECCAVLEGPAVVSGRPRGPVRDYAESGGAARERVGEGAQSWESRRRDRVRSGDAGPLLHRRGARPCRQGLPRDRARLGDR